MRLSMDRTFDPHRRGALATSIRVLIRERAAYLAGEL